MEFTFKRKQIVVPSPPSPHHVVNLSNIDQIMPRLDVLAPALYFFPPPSAPPSSASLTGSLGRALAAFPPAAGRLKPRSNGGGFDVECHNQGAVFVEAHATATLDQLLNTGNGDVRGGMYQPSPLWTSLCPTVYDEEFMDNPILCIQLTILRCGGVVVAVLLSHQVGDGTARSHFLASWAELARGQPITTHPHLDRVGIQARIPPCPPSYEHKEYAIYKTPPATKAQLPPIARRIFEFLPHDMQELKKRADAEVGGGDVFTRFEALVAHIWKHVTKARGVEASQQIKLGWTVDGRKRFNPPLPPSFFGNAVFYGCVEQRAGDVVAQPLGKAAKLIRGGTQRVTDDYMRSALDLIAAQPSPDLISASFKAPVDVRVSSWAFFKPFVVDWGWGRPLFFAPSWHVPVPGVVLLLPHANHARAMNAHIALFQPEMDALLSDTQFHPIPPNPII